VGWVILCLALMPLGCKDPPPQVVVASDAQHNAVDPAELTQRITVHGRAAMALVLVDAGGTSVATTREAQYPAGDYVLHIRRTLNGEAQRGLLAGFEPRGLEHCPLPAPDAAVDRIASRMTRGSVFAVPQAASTTNRFPIVDVTVRRGPELVQTYRLLLRTSRADP